MRLKEGTRIQILSPVVRGKKGEHAKVFEDAKKSGFVRLRVDGNIYDVSEDIKLEKTKKHNIEIIVDRLIVKDGINARLTDSLETAMRQAGGLVIAELVEKGEELVFSQEYACHECGISVEELARVCFPLTARSEHAPHVPGLAFK